MSENPFLVQVSATEFGKVGHSFEWGEGGAAIHNRALRQGGRQILSPINDIWGSAFRVKNSGFSFGV